MPKIKDLVKEFGLTRQAFYAMKKVTPDKFQIYIDAYKYRELKKEMQSET